MEVFNNNNFGFPPFSSTTEQQQQPQPQPQQQGQQQRDPQFHFGPFPNANTPTNFQYNPQPFFFNTEVLPIDMNNNNNIDNIPSPTIPLPPQEEPSGDLPESSSSSKKKRKSESMEVESNDSFVSPTLPRKKLHRLKKIIQQELSPTQQQRFIEQLQDMQLKRIQFSFPIVAQHLRILSSAAVLGRIIFRYQSFLPFHSIQLMICYICLIREHACN